jgi:membrane associated rhomboid family serine protease
MLLPIRSKNPPESLPIGTCFLIFINVVVYVLTTDGLLSVQRNALERFAVRWADFTLMRSITSMFLHAEPMHLIGNMWFLYLFGFAVEGRLRTPRFLLLYFGAGLAGDLIHQLLVGASIPLQWSLGASGAIMGVMGAALYMFPFSKIDCWAGYGFRFSWDVYTLDMIWVALIYVGLDLLPVVIGYQDGVGHVAHLAGLICGVVICALMFPKRDSSNVSEVKEILADTKDYGTLSGHEIAELAPTDPDNTTLALHWMDRCLRDGRMMPECESSFRRLLPRIIREEPVQAVGSALSALARTANYIAAEDLLTVSARLELKGEPSFALALLDQALRLPDITPSAYESALFRSAVLYERLRNLDQARCRYQEVVSKYGISPLGEQAARRLKELPTS